MGDTIVVAAIDNDKDCDDEKDIETNDGDVADQKIPSIDEMTVRNPNVKITACGKKIYMQRCTKCNAEYRMKSLCVDHYYAVHLNIKRHVCNICNSEFVNQSSMCLHQRIKHNMFSGPPKKQTKRKSIEVKQEPLTEETEVDVENSTESYTTDSKPQLSPVKKKKVKSQHPDYSKEKIACDVCGKAFNWKSNLNAHKRRNHPTMGINFKCKFCNVGFKWFGSYHSHLRKFHTGIPVICDDCGNVFSDSGAAKKHLESQLVKCDICDGEFNSICKLTQHTVNNFEDLTCCKCTGLNFTNFFTVWKHKTKIHSCETIKCCQKNYMRIKTYQQHLKVVHYNIKNDKADSVQRMKQIESEPPI